MNFLSNWYSYITAGLAITTAVVYWILTTKVAELTTLKNEDRRTLKELLQSDDRPEDIAVTVGSRIIDNNNNSIEHFDFNEKSKNSLESVAEEIATCEAISNENEIERLQECLVLLDSIVKTKKTINELKKIKYDSNDKSHEKKLMELWNGLRPFHRLPSRLCKEWGEIGFQGQDPATDFRGMGMLGLEQLLYFTTKHNKTALKVLKLSQGDGSDLSGFPFAITGINLTSILLERLNANQLDFALQLPCCEESFHELYCKVFATFAEEYIASNPTNIMDFPPFLQQFKTKRLPDVVQK